MDTSLFPTKSNLLKAKHSLSLARLGYFLMDKKRTILIKEMMQLIETAKQIQSRIDVTFSEAYEALQRANITLGKIRTLALAVPVDDSVDIKYKSVMGIEIPSLTSEPPTPGIHYGFNSTNSALDNAYQKFLKVKELTLELAEIENSVYRLANAIKKIQKRTNALSNIIVPRFERAVVFITNELEEKEREEFSRLKMIKRTKI